jgi:hypothetical protein
MHLLYIIDRPYTRNTHRLIHELFNELEIFVIRESLELHTTGSTFSSMVGAGAAAATLA